MSEREKPRRKSLYEEIDLPKEKPVEEPTIEEKKIEQESIPSEQTSSPEVTTTQPAVSVESIHSKQKAKFESSLPRWVNAPWMYIVPTKEDQLQSWLESWRAVIIDYSRIFVLHVLNIDDVRQVFPFRNQSVNKELSADTLRELCDFMIEEGIAEWLDYSRVRLRVYWRSHAEWADRIYGFMMDTGRVVDLHTLYDLSTYEQEWSTLPSVDITKVVEELVTQGKVRWANRDQTAIRFIIT
ncbi:MAG: hypothetical protein ACTSYA_12345 [Candidatus Kariarchaeaceae archaeon]